MIVVTGSCRSGTSMLMQTLNLLGVPIEGEAVHPDFPIVEGNPKGYFDLPFKTLKEGLGEEYVGKAVKLLGEWLHFTNPTQATHLFICKRRDTRAQDKSTMDLLKLEQEVESESEERKILLELCSNMTPDEISERRRINYNLISEWRKYFRGYIKEVYFEDMIYQPLKTIEEIREFLFLDVDIKEAVENIGIEKNVGADI